MMGRIRAVRQSDLGFIGSGDRASSKTLAGSIGHLPPKGKTSSAGMELRNELGRSVWQLARVLVLSNDPGAWSSNVAVQPFASCMNDVRGYLEVAREFPELTAPSSTPRTLFGLASPQLWRFPRIRKRLKRVVTWTRSTLNRRLSRRGVYLVRMPSPVTAAELEQMHELLDHIETFGVGAPRDRLVYGRFFVGMAARLLQKPSLEHAMALRLLSYVGDHLKLESVWAEAMDGFWLVRSRRHLKRLLGPAYEEEADKWRRIYSCRQRFVEADKSRHEYRIRAQGVLARIKNKANYEVDLATAESRYLEAITEAMALQGCSPAHYPRHVVDQARFKLWTVAVAAGRSDRAVELWGRMWVESNEFCLREVTMLTEFPTYAAEFAAQESLPADVKQQVSELLRRARSHLDLQARRKTSAQKEAAFQIRRAQALVDRSGADSETLEV